MTNSNQIASIEQRTRALRQALEENKVLSSESLDQFDHMIDDWNPQNGARVVARAWLEPEYKSRLLENGTAACAEMGYAGPQGEYIVVLENNPKCHNVIVCTQCSCTAWPVLGLPPDWYKSPEYRARVAREPRRVLRELGLDLEPSIAIRVWETSAETRYMVLPMRPDDTSGWTMEQLAGLVTRDALIGTALVRSPS